MPFDLLTALLDSWTVRNRAAGRDSRGREWRAEYLRLTYRCGAYEPYEALVADTAQNVGMDTEAATRLEHGWSTPPVWSGANETLAALKKRGYTLAIVTNCSRRMGSQAAARLDIAWYSIFTAEQAGFYKPNVVPYRMALEQLGVNATEACFVAGSGYDLFGTHSVGLRTYWHNRVGLAALAGAPPAQFESRTLDDVLPWIDSL